MTESPPESPEAASGPENEPETRPCVRCGDPVDLPPADAAIPFCAACLRAASLRPVST